MHLDKNPANGGSCHSDRRNKNIWIVLRIFFGIVISVWFKGMYCKTSRSTEQNSWPTFTLFRLQKDKVPQIWILNTWTIFKNKTEMDNSVSVDCGEGNWNKLHQDHNDVWLPPTGSLFYLTNVCSTSCRLFVVL